MTDQNYDQEVNGTSWDQARFVGKMIWATQNHPISGSDLPSQIDLSGVVGKHIDGLIAEMQADPQHREHGKYAIVGLDKKLHISHQSQVGSENNIRMMGEMQMLVDSSNPVYSDREFMAFSMHTHPVDVPPSPNDFMELLIDQADGGTQAMIVGTETARFIIMRTLQTPEMSRDEAKNLVEGWKKAYYKEASIHTSVSNSRDYLNRKDTQQQISFVMDTCRDYKLGLFIAVGNNRFKR